LPGLGGASRPEPSSRRLPNDWRTRRGTIDRGRRAANEVKSVVMSGCFLAAGADELAVGLEPNDGRALSLAESERKR
jgi:hypothetical protein